MKQTKNICSVPFTTLLSRVDFSVLDQKQDNCGSMIPSDYKDQGKYTQIQLGLSDNVISALQYENILTSADSIMHVQKCSIIQWIHYHVMAIRMVEMR